jgi:prepilin-type N-terminal cleavage/methylation domain-containing protein
VGQKLKLVNRNKNENGFTLIEVLVSIVILFIILITFFSFFGQSLKFSGKNEEQLVSYNLASKTLRIIENTYKNTNMVDSITLNNCTSLGYPAALKNVLDSNCQYKENQMFYIPEVTITKQTFSEFSNPKVYLISVKIYSADRKLLSETFGYIRGK